MVVYSGYKNNGLIRKKLPSEHVVLFLSDELFIDSS